VHIFRSGYNIECKYSDSVTKMGSHIQKKIIILNDGRQAKRKPTHKSRRSCIKMQNKLCRRGISEDMRLICFVEIMLTNTCVIVHNYELLFQLMHFFYTAFSLEKDFFTWREYGQSSAGSDKISYIYTNRTRFK